MGTAVIKNEAKNAGAGHLQFFPANVSKSVLLSTFSANLCTPPHKKIPTPTPTKKQTSNHTSDASHDVYVCMMNVAHRGNIISEKSSICSICTVYSEADLGSSACSAEQGPLQKGAPQKQFASERLASNCHTAAAAIVVCIAARVLNKMSMMTTVRVG